MSATVSENMRQTGFVLPVGRINMNEFVHSWLKVPWVVIFLCYLQLARLSVFSPHCPVTGLSICLYSESQCLSPGMHRFDRLSCITWDGFSYKIQLEFC